MSSTPNFLIIDAYPKESREELAAAGMKPAWKLYQEMLKRHIPKADSRIWLASDEPAPPGGLGPENYRGVLWTGCNLTIYHKDDIRVTRQIELARRAYAVGTPSFGTCWGIQMAAVAAGGEVKANPRGREMGLARNVGLSAAGLKHPMTAGKPAIYCGFISHLDEVTGLPRGASLLATNDFTRVQALAIKHKKGTFWATQYHPEYDLHQMARLVVARTARLITEGFFKSPAEAESFISKLEALYADPKRKDLRWQLGVGDDVLDADLRQLEFSNWLKALVLKSRR